MDLATLGARRLEVVVIVDEEGRGGMGDNEGAGVGVGVGSRGGSDDVDGTRGGGRGDRSLSFRLKTGRSPKNRIHLTEGQTGNSGKSSSASQ